MKLRFNAGGNSFDFRIPTVSALCGVAIATKIGPKINLFAGILFMCGMYG
jgi:hypothetical protein